MSETNTFNSTFLVVENPEEFKDLYNFQLEVDKRFTKEIYLDSADFISLMLGLNDFKQIKGKKNDQSFNFPLFNHKRTMMHGFMYKKYLGELKLLNPHMFEFLEKLNPKTLLAENKIDINDTNFSIRLYIEEMIENLDLIDIAIDKYTNDRSLFKDVLTQVEPRFKLTYLMAGMSTKARALHLKRQGVFSFSIDDEFNIPELTETDLFKKLYHYLETEGTQKKEKNYPTDIIKSQNNFHDALAMCQLQGKLDAFYHELAEAETKNLPTKSIRLPIFYARPNIKKAIEKILEDDSFDISGRKPFTFKGESGEHLIIQNEDFFLLDGLYQYNVSENKGLNIDEFFRQIKDYSESTKKLGQESEHITEELKQELEKAVHLDFFHKWWKANGKAELENSFKLINNSDLNLEKLDEEFAKEYDEVKLKVSKYNLGLKYIKIAFESEFQRSISLKHNKEGKFLYDLEQEFLTRFSYSSEMLKNIQSYIENLYKSYKNEEAKTHLKIEMLNHLQYVIDQDVLKDNKLPMNPKLEKLWIMLSILWIEMKYDLLCEFCEAIRTTMQINPTGDLYPNYQIGFLHAAAMLKTKLKIDYKKIEGILQCIHKKYSAKSYRSLIGEAFIYSKLWEADNQNLSIPEVKKLYQDIVIIKGSKSQQYYHSCRDLSLEAFNHLETLKLKQEFDNDMQRRSYYAINLYVYIETQNRSLADFPGDLNNYIIYLEGIPDLLEHERYLDTLARYNQRIAAKIAIESPKDQIKYKKYIKMAKEKIKTAISLASKKKNKEDLPTFNSFLTGLEKMEVEGCQYFENYRP